MNSTPLFSSKQPVRGTRTFEPIAERMSKTCDIDGDFACVDASENYQKKKKKRKTFFKISLSKVTATHAKKKKEEK